MITLRKAQLSDSEMVFAWRNAPETRRYFFDSAPIEKQQHINWFTHSLTNPTRHFLIAEQNGDAMGVIRFDIDHHENAEIDIYLKPGLAGQGLGSRILTTATEWVAIHLPMVKKLIANVLSDNIASHRAFEKAHFTKKITIYEKIIEGR